ncbi:MAG: hypothetical protein JXL84_15495 [Deltaproteobacteria bacterium]|nr:hypothetical protein [Deltaproteobacteria bacterium]
MKTEEDKSTEEGSIPDGDARQTAGEDQQDLRGGEGEEKPADRPRAVFRVFLGSVLRRKWFLVSALTLVLALAGFGVFRNMEGETGSGKVAGVGSTGSGPRDSLRQEDLTRFYIPLPQGAENQVMALDLSVAWDALSAVRFKKMEVQGRDRLYSYLRGLAGKGETFQERVSLLEEEMSRILRELLRTDSLVIKIREVKAF